MLPDRLSSASPTGSSRVKTSHLTKCQILSPAKATALQKVCKIRNQLEAQLKTAKGPAQRKKAQHSYVNSGAVKMATLVEIAKEDGTDLETEWDALEKLAKTISLVEKMDDPVIVTAVKKSNGEPRAIFKFGLRHRVAQRMVVVMLKACFTPVSWQFNTGGKSRHDLVQAIRGAYQKGYVCGRHLDIRKFYRSFSHEGLNPYLPLPKKVIEFVATGRHMNYQIHGECTGQQSYIGSFLKDEIEYDRTAGILPGSALSSALGDYVISKLDIKAGVAFFVANYVDDFLVLTQSVKALDDAEKALHEALASVPAGHFKLGEKHDDVASPSFGFVSYTFIPTADGLFVGVSPKQEHKITNFAAENIEFAEYTLSKSKGKSDVADFLMWQAAKFVGHIIGWLNAFQDADGIAEIEGELWALVSIYCDDIGLDVAEVKAHAGHYVTPESEIGAYG